jgi:plasmid stabilization system protein ParE
MSRYRLLKGAERDLIEIARYIVEKASLAVAERLLAEIIETTIVLAAQPGVGRNEERYGKGMKSFPSQKYKIYYRARKDGILVLHVFHTSRDQKKAWTHSTGAGKKPI